MPCRRNDRSGGHRPPSYGRGACDAVGRSLDLSRLQIKKALTLANQGFLFGAGEMNRTPDLLITNELLYRLSYTGLALHYSVEW